MENGICNLLSAIYSHRAVLGRYCLLADSADVIEIVGVEILVAIVFSSQGRYMHSECIFQLLVNLPAYTAQHRRDGVLRAKEQRGHAESCGEACHLVGTACLLLVEICGEEMS